MDFFVGLAMLTEADLISGPPWLIGLFLEADSFITRRILCALPWVRRGNIHMSSL